MAGVGDLRIRRLDHRANDGEDPFELVGLGVLVLQTGDPLPPNRCSSSEASTQAGIDSLAPSRVSRPTIELARRIEAPARSDLERPKTPKARPLGWERSWSLAQNEPHGSAAGELSNRIAVSASASHSPVPGCTRMA